jgi:hypothetical protein
MNWKALILAIAMVESGNDPGAVGKHGEVSHLQISDIMRREFYRIAPMHEPRSMQELRREPEFVEYMFRVLVVKNHCDKSVMSAALFWHHGGGWMTKTNKNLDYARRVNNLYQEYTKGDENEDRKRTVCR